MKQYLAERLEELVGVLAVCLAVHHFFGWWGVMLAIGILLLKGPRPLY